jgi:transposase InsO family protein
VAGRCTSAGVDDRGAGHGHSTTAARRGFIHHSGRGSQYAAGDYRELLKANGIVPSMSRKAKCWDNTPMESWFHILKTELVHPPAVGK